MRNTHAHNDRTLNIQNTNIKCIFQQILILKNDISDDNVTYDEPVYVITNNTILKIVYDLLFYLSTYLFGAGMCFFFLKKMCLSSPFGVIKYFDFNKGIFLVKKLNLVSTLATKSK